MDRRGFLKTSGAAAAVAATSATAASNAPGAEIPAPAIHTGARQFTMTTAWPEGVAGPCDMALRLALRIREASGDRIHLNLDHSGTADADFHHGSEHDRAILHPAFSYFAGLPADAALAPADLESWIAYGGGQNLWDELAAPHGDKPLLAGHLGADPLLWSTRDLKGAESCRGLRVAACGPAAEVARALGAEPVDIPISSIPAAFAAGEIDTVEFGGTLNAMGAGIAAKARYAFSPGLTPAGTAVALRVHLDVWESLSQADRAIVTACAGEAYRSSLSEVRLSQRMLLTTLKKRNALKFRTLPSDIHAALPHLSEAVVAALAGHDKTSRRINASYMGFRHNLEDNHKPSPPVA